MSLTVTVQKGHDFSSGNVTRAALNAGAVPTVAVTGSVGTSELAADAITATELADDAVTTDSILNVNVTTAKIADDAVDLTKLNYPGNKGAIIKMGDTADAGTVIPETMETRLAGKILIGDGVDLLSLGDQSGNVEDTPVTETQPKSHVAIGIEAREDDTPSTGVLLTLKDFAIKVAKLAKNIVAGNATPGIIVYDNAGVASVLASTNTESSVLTTNTTSTPSFKISNKIVDVKSPLDSSKTTAVVTDSNEIYVAGHDITSGTPIITGVFFECITTDKGYATGDRIYDLTNNQSHNIYAFVEGDNVGVFMEYSSKFYDKEDAYQGTPANLSYITPSKWKVCVTVSEV
jgi:hypothetical protein